MKNSELEYRLLYAMVVAGKSAKFAENVMKGFLEHCPRNKSPLSFVRELVRRGGLESRLRLYRSGNYGKLVRGFKDLGERRFNLATVTPAQLEEIHGIGPKTSRFFILWTRPEARYAALDTHVLKWLGYLGHVVPKSTPNKGKYAGLERIFLSEADGRKMTPRELDAAIWYWCSSGRHVGGEWPEKLRRPAP